MNKGYKFSKAARENMSKSHLGSTRSDTTKKKMSIAALKAHEEGRHGGFKKGHSVNKGKTWTINDTSNMCGYTYPKMCPYCKTVYYVVPSLLDSENCCSDKCRRKYYLLEKAHNWKGGDSQLSDGRHVLYKKEGRILRSRYRVEQSLGRKLVKGEIVHHIDNDCTNDELTNLYLFPRMGMHMKSHKQKLSHLLVSNVI